MPNGTETEHQHIQAARETFVLALLVIGIVVMLLFSAAL